MCLNACSQSINSLPFAWTWYGIVSKAQTNSTASQMPEILAARRLETRFLKACA
ncbi:MAG: hypothetical protein WBA89_27060 [Microcoleus sp.]